MNTTDTDFLNEDYVSFETADLMRMKGFPQKRENSGYYATEMVYGITEQDDGTHHLCHQYPACYHFDDHICAPTLQMAMKWLREMYKCCIVIDPKVTDDDGSAGCLWGWVISIRLRHQYTSEELYDL